jgi:hypothetical protein
MQVNEPLMVGGQDLDLIGRLLTNLRSYYEEREEKKG